MNVHRHGWDFQQNLEERRKQARENVRASKEVHEENLR